jgi:hypothetical protein
MQGNITGARGKVCPKMKKNRFPVEMNRLSTKHFG